jgi:hypothetical protein
MPVFALDATCLVTQCFCRLAIVPALRALLLQPNFQGYDTYIKVFYALVAVIFLLLVLSTWLAIALKKDESMESGWTGT